MLYTFIFIISYIYIYIYIGIHSSWSPARFTCKRDVHGYWKQPSVAVAVCCSVCCSAFHSALQFVEVRCSALQCCMANGISCR